MRRGLSRGRGAARGRGRARCVESLCDSGSSSMILRANGPIDNHNAPLSVGVRVGPEPVLAAGSHGQSGRCCSWDVRERPHGCGDGDSKTTRRRDRLCGTGRCRRRVTGLQPRQPHGSSMSLAVGRQEARSGPWCTLPGGRAAAGDGSHGPAAGGRLHRAMSPAAGPPEHACARRPGVGPALKIATLRR